MVKILRRLKRRFIVWYNNPYSPGTRMALRRNRRLSKEYRTRWHHRWYT